MLDEARKKQLEAMGFRVVQFDQEGQVIGNAAISKDYEVALDPNHWSAYLYPYGKNDVYWAWPRTPVPATEAECWAAIEQAVAGNEIDFEKFRAEQTNG